MLKRKCIVTNKIQDVTKMIRIVKTKDGQFHVNSDNKGRGAYVSNDASLIKELTKNKTLNRSFKTNVPNDVYDQLIKIMEGNNG